MTFFTYNKIINRETDPSFSDPGLLHSIKYPTGGVSVFTYENNIVKPPDFIDKLLTHSNTPWKQETVHATVLRKKRILFRSNVF